MNYLTNYYKNLSEKLQHRVNHLENQAKMINEAVTTMSVYNAGRASGDAFGGSGIPGDYNGDGVVDGYDLGIALGNYGQPGYDFQNTLQNRTQQTAPTNFRSATAGGRRTDTRDSSPSSGGRMGSRDSGRGAFPTSGGAMPGGRDPGRGAFPTSGGAMPGGGGIPGDYNGDGRVDGADLGIALGNYGQPGYDFQNTLNNWTPPQRSGQITYRSTRSPRSSNSMELEGEMGGSSPTGIPGDYNGDGRVDGADLGLALGNYGQPGYDFQTTLNNWTGSGVGGGGAERPTFRAPRPSNIRPKRTY